jgi:hypothetical protein
MDVIKLLKEDHRKLKGLFAELEGTEHAEKRFRLLNEIEKEIRIHSRAEENLVYPAYREIAEKKKEKEMFFEANAEHHAVDLFLPELRDVDISSDVFKARATVLREMIEHHVEEEETEMFKTLREHMKKEELENLGIEVRHFKQDLEERYPQIDTIMTARTAAAAGKRV